jgi:hypothetical protein
MHAIGYTHARRNLGNSGWQRCRPVGIARQSWRGPIGNRCLAAQAFQLGTHLTHAEQIFFFFFFVILRTYLGASRRGRRMEGLRSLHGGEDLLDLVDDVVDIVVEAIRHASEEEGAPEAAGRHYPKPS